MLVRTGLVLLAALVMFAGSPPVGHADESDDELPAGRLGVRLGVRGGSGLYDFGIGFTIGLAAGYHPMRLDQRVSVGMEWAAAWSRFEFADDQASITGTIRFMEFEFGGRLRLRPSMTHRHFLGLALGVAMTRSSVPIPPDGERAYVGPYASVGLEPSFGDTTLAFDVRYSMLALGPRTIMLTMTASRGH